MVVTWPVALGALDHRHRDDGECDNLDDGCKVDDCDLRATVLKNNFSSHVVIQT